MGRRYYCDYCDKTFIDDLEARRKHLQSAHHIKMRNLHYQNARDPSIILREELLKTPCKRFAQYGSCQFEANCKYTHYLPEQLVELRQQVEQIEISKRRKQEDIPEIPSIDLWLQKYNQTQNKKDSNVIQTSWHYMDSLEGRPDLPPSLVRFRPEHFFDDNFEEWGN